MNEDMPDDLEIAISAVTKRMVCNMSDYWLQNLSIWLPELKKLRKFQATTTVEMFKLLKKNELLEKEADWLAGALPMSAHDDSRQVAIMHWREAARKAVESANVQN